MCIRDRVIPNQIEGESIRRIWQRNARGRHDIGFGPKKRMRLRNTEVERQQQFFYFPKSFRIEEPFTGYIGITLSTFCNNFFGTGK